MDKLTAADLYSLEEYHKHRTEFRARVLAHKRQRQIALGPIATLYFEDRLTMQYQVQEMLRIERIFETEAIEEELAAYNPLIPDGTNLKATLMIEVTDVDERRSVLQQLAGFEDAVYAQVSEFDRVFAHADEDLDRGTTEKTSAVHFVRFEFSKPMCSSLKGGAPLLLGVDHRHYRHEVSVSESSLSALIADLD